MITAFSIRRRAINLFVYFSVIALWGCSEKADTTIIITGSTTAGPVLQLAAKRYMQKKDIKIKVLFTGSKNGVKALTEGTCNIADSSSKISLKTVTDAHLKGIHIKEFVFAHDMIVPIIHPNNPVEDLSLEQLNAIFTGSIETWDEVGGKNNKISVVGRDTFSGTGEVWEKIVISRGKIREDHVTLHTNSEVLAYVAKHPDAIGYISFAYANPEIKMVSVNGIEPGIEAVKGQKYPVYRNLYLYVNEKDFSYEMKAFIIYLLSNEGQEIIEENGFIPLNLLEDIPQKLHKQGSRGKSKFRIPGD